MAKVVVIGSGNAGLCAALSAREAGVDVTLLERAPLTERGGNSSYAAGAMRVAYEDAEHLLKLIPDLSSDELRNNDFGSYPESEFFNDMARVTETRCDPDLSAILVEHSFETLQWMMSKGIRFAPTYHRQAFSVNGRFRFWGGLTVEVVGGGMGLVDTLFKTAEREGVEIRYGARAIGLDYTNGQIAGVHVRPNAGGPIHTIAADAVVLASGGFEANTEWRTRYLGPGWDLAKVRGTRFNTGDGIRMALDIGAMAVGNWSGCHAVSWDRNAPDFGDRKIGDGFQKHSYPFGIMINANGRRFVDEGADFRNYTYARYGSEILRQPGQYAWQIFDAKASPLLRDEYRIKEITKVSAPTLQGLAEKLDGVPTDAFLETVREFNGAIQTDVDFDPNVKDGRGTLGLDPAKSNWAVALDTPPFEGYLVTCGITFTFGGLAITSSNAQVLGEEGQPLGELYACGELVGGLFYFNYPGGAGLTSGAVFGRLAGASAARGALAQAASALPALFINASGDG